jgi:signal transduction histidine kinase
LSDRACRFGGKLPAAEAASPVEVGIVNRMTAAPVNSDHAKRIDDLGEIILAYSDVTEKLQQSHDQLTQTVHALQLELSEKNRQLERRNRLAALGEMAAGMAHEIRNPLGGIQLYSSILVKELADRPETLQLVHKITGGVKLLDGLVSQVLQFTREITAHAATVDLAEVIDQAVDLASHSLQMRNVICRVNGPRPMPVTIDPLLAGQAMLNLILNAAEAIGDSGTINVRFGLPTDGDPRQFYLVVTDSGPGIPADVLDKIFNPFFTTKESGTGLGLAIVHRVVEAHDGTITASNMDGGGAKFEVRI